MNICVYLWYVYAFGPLSLMLAHHGFDFTGYYSMLDLE